MSPSPPYRKHAGPLTVVCLVLLFFAVVLAGMTFMRRQWITCGIDVALAVLLGCMFRYWYWRTATGVKVRALHDSLIQEARLRYVGRACWIEDSAGWSLRFDPKLVVPPMTKMDFEAPWPPDLGGPVGWFPVRFNFIPIGSTVGSGDAS